MTTKEWSAEFRDECAREADVQARWDEFIRHRPICADCGEHITSVRCLVLDDGSCLCPRCVRERMRLTEDCA